MTASARIWLWLVGAALLLLVGVSVWYLSGLKLSSSLPPSIGSSATSTPSVTYENASVNDITVTTPTPGAVTGKSFKVVGKARGSWYFEASFPIEVRDPEGVVLTTVVAQAEGEWMTSNFVPFSVDVTIPASYQGPATIVLHKDNPSGLAEHDASASFPITVEH